MSSKDTPAPIPVPVTNSVPPPSYTCVLVELPMPPRVSGTSIKQLLINDAMLEKAVKETTQCLYVHVLAPSDATASPPSSTAVARMRAYVSAIYERLWDEMVGREHLSLKCIVTCGARDGEGDEEEGGEAFPRRAQVYMEPSLEAVFCYPGGEDAGGVYMAKRNAERVSVACTWSREI
jgi:hypothetical protein